MTMFFKIEFSCPTVYHHIEERNTLLQLNCCNLWINGNEFPTITYILEAPPPDFVDTAEFVLEYLQNICPSATIERVDGSDQLSKRFVSIIHANIHQSKL